MSSPRETVYESESAIDGSLFSEYPRLADRLPRVCLGGLPTPITKLDALSASSCTEIFVKRDDLAGDVYGGNKVRKLETLLGHARAIGAKGILTFGYFRSGHALATTIYARKIGLPVTCILLEEVDRNAGEHLLLLHNYGATLVHCTVERFAQQAEAIVEEQVRNFERLYGARPLIFPFGGTSAIGTVPYVDAAFELKQQINDGVIPEPDYLYVPLASTGTAAGLACGLRAARLKTRVIAVKVVEPQYAKEEKLLSLFRETNELLHCTDSSFPILDPRDANLEIRHGYCGPAYGVPTPEALEAVNLAANEGIRLEPTYTGKAFAALHDDLLRWKLTDKTILFWHTANSRDMSAHVAGVDYRSLPDEFHQYF